MKANNTVKSEKSVSMYINEEWRSLKGSLTEFSNYGRVRVNATLYKDGRVTVNDEYRMVAAPPNTSGYPVCRVIWEDGTSKFITVHKAVFLAFSGLDSIPAGYQINHINEVKSDASYTNLELVTPSQNQAYGMRNAKRKRSLTMDVRDINTGKTWKSIIECARETGLCKQHISAVLNGDRPRTATYNFTFTNGTTHPKEKLF